MYIIQYQSTCIKLLEVAVQIDVDESNIVDLEIQRVVY